MGRVVERCHLVIVIDAGMDWDGWVPHCTAHMPCPRPMSMPMPMPCCAHAAPYPRVPAVVVEQARQGELDSGDDP